MEEVVVDPGSPSSGASTSTVLPPPPDLIPSAFLLPLPLEQEEGPVVMRREPSARSSSLVSLAPATLADGTNVGTSESHVAIRMYLRGMIAVVVILPAVAAIKIFHCCCRRSSRQRPSKAPNPDPEESSKKKKSRPRATADETIASLGQQRGLQMEAGPQTRQTTMAARKNELLP